MRLRQIAGRRSFVAAVALASAFGLGVSGCGNASNIQGEHLTKVSFASAMTSATSKVSSVHMRMVITTQGKHITANADMSMNGIVAGASLGDDLKKMSMSMSMVIPSTGSVQMRLVDGVLYMHLPASALGSAMPKPWIKFDLNDPNNPLGSVLSELDHLNPASMGKIFQSITTLDNLGADTVDGVPATHYRVGVDTAKVANLLGLPAGTDLSSMPKTLMYDVWIGHDGRPVEMVMHQPQGSMEMHFSGWNQPVKIVAPPASQVGTLPH